MRANLPTMLALLTLAELAGCGGSGPDSCDGRRMGTLVREDRLCGLTCDATTRDQAIELLGPPDSSFGSTSISYTYMCVTASAVNELLVSLDFDATSGVLTRVSRMGMGTYASGTLPSCLDPCSER